MWDSLESIWQAACALPDAKVYVMPIPYFDRTADGSLGERHYEGEFLPPEVPVTDWHDFDIAKERPDIIFIHMPYDDRNRLTSVHPIFYAVNLRPYTNNLIYVPYFVLSVTAPKMLMLTAGVVEADFVFVQSETIKQFYLAALPLEAKTFAPQDERLRKMDWKKKIIPLGSPKTDRVLRELSAPQPVPKEWESVIDGRKVIFFNTNVNMILQNPKGFLANLERIFAVFARHGKEYAVIWREHPLSMEAMKTQEASIADQYAQIRKSFRQQGWGIIDRTHDPYTAMRATDCYYGAAGSMTLLYGLTGKPMMVTSYGYPKGISKKQATLDAVLATQKDKLHFKEKNVNSLELYLDHLPAFADMEKQRMVVARKLANNLDGSVGRKILHFVMKHGKGL